MKGVKQKKVTRRRVQLAMPQCNGNVTTLADLLGCNRVQVYRLMKEDGNEDLWEELQQMRDSIFDKAVDKLEEAIDNGQEWAIKTALLHYRRQQLFGQKTEVDVTSGGDKIETLVIAGQKITL